MRPHFLIYSVSDNVVSSKMYEELYDFDFDIVNFPFLKADSLLSTSHGCNIVCHDS